MQADTRKMLSNMLAIDAQAKFNGIDQMFCIYRPCNILNC